jgi:hypothetical protein
MVPKMDVREGLIVGACLIHLVQDRDQWWALVNMVMNFQIL